jgi:hypothetical protein
MKRLFPGISLVAILFGPTPARAQTLYACGDGTVQGVRAVTEKLIRETVTTRRSEEGELNAFVETTDEKQHTAYVVSVELEDRLYTSQSAGDPYGTLDPMRLATGDAIHICVNSAQMILERSDGKDYRAPVVRSDVSAGPKTGTPSPRTTSKTSR